MNLKPILFLLPSLMFLKINFIGELYITELISLFILIIYLKKEYFFIIQNLRVFYIFSFIFLITQIISDLYMDTPSNDYLRGWSNIIFFIINVTTLFILIKNKIENIYIFSCGLIFGIFLTFFLNPNVYAQGGQYWKFGIGYALTFLIALITTRISFQNLNLKIFIFLFLSALNFYMGFRSLAGVCFLVAVLMLLNGLITF